MRWLFFLYRRFRCRTVLLYVPQIAIPFAVIACTNTISPTSKLSSGAAQIAVYCLAYMRTIPRPLAGILSVTTALAPMCRCRLRRFERQNPTRKIEAIAKKQIACFQKEISVKDKKRQTHVPGRKQIVMRRLRIASVHIRSRHTAIQK